VKVILPAQIVDTLRSELKMAGRREIGGILMGEHTGEEEFKVCDITIQRIGGSFAFFERAAHNVLSAMARFFDRTGQNYKRFNYLGEWHSHPSFVPTPSSVDYETMIDLTSDPSFRGNFAVLMIIKLDASGRLDGSVNIFYPGKSPQTGELIIGSHA
jgi:[CysO sulfur-carrier protein]-S-L-cysteine hydrolase